VKKVGALLRACRERAGLSQEELADRLNRSQSCISKYETDQKIPDIFTFLNWLQVTQAQEVAVAYLLGFDGLTILQQLMTVLVGG